MLNFIFFSDFINASPVINTSGYKEKCLLTFEKNIVSNGDIPGQHKNKQLLLSGFFPRSPFAVNGRFRGFKNKRSVKGKLNSYLFREEYCEFINELNSYLKIINCNSNESAPENLNVYVYWKIGERLCNNPFLNVKDPEVIKHVSADIKEDMKTLENYILLYLRFKKISDELSWDHYSVLINEQDSLKQKFYHNLSVLKTLSPLELKKSMDSDIYNAYVKNEVQKVLNSFIVLLNPDEILKEYMLLTTASLLKYNNFIDTIVKISDKAYV